MRSIFCEYVKVGIKSFKYAKFSMISSLENWQSGRVARESISVPQKLLSDENLKSCRLFRRVIFLYSQIGTIRPNHSK